MVLQSLETYVNVLGTKFISNLYSVGRKTGAMRYQMSVIEAYASETETPIIIDYPHLCPHMIDEITLHELNFNKLQFEIIYKIIGRESNNEIKLVDLSKLSNKHFKQYTDLFYSNQCLIWIKLRNLLLNHIDECHLNTNNNFYIKPIFKEPGHQSIPIGEMNLSTRSKNILQRHGYKYSHDLINLNLEKLLSFPNLGQYSALNISEELQNLNIWQNKNGATSDFDKTYIRPNLAKNIDYEPDKIEFIGFTTRTYNCLKRAGIHHISDLIAIDHFEIKDIRNLGQKSYEEILAVLKSANSQLAKVPSGPTNITENAAKIEEITDVINRQIFHDMRLIEQNFPNILELNIYRHGIQEKSISALLNKYFDLNVRSIEDIFRYLKLELGASPNAGHYYFQVYDAIYLISFLSDFLSRREINHSNEELLTTVYKLDGLYHSLSPDLINFDEVISFLFGEDTLGFVGKLSCVNFIDIKELETSSLVLNFEFNELLRNIDNFCSKYETLPNFLGLVIGMQTYGEKSKVNNLLFDYLEYLRPNSFERDFKIICQRLMGLTLDEIASPLGLTRERIRQIINKLNPRLPELIDILVENSNLTAENIVQSKILQLFAEKGAVYISELESVTGFKYHHIFKLIPIWNRKFIMDSNRANMNSGKWSRVDLIKIIKKASTYYFPLTGPDYQHLIDIGEIEGPGIQRIYQVYGTWSQLCTEAGVEFRPSLRGSYDRLWSDDELVSFIIRFLEDKTVLSSFDEYSLWRGKQTDRIPDSGTIRNYFGTWSLAKNNALEVIRNRKSEGVKN